MEISEKLQYLQDNHFSEWLEKRREVEKRVSDNQTMFCICGRLVTGLHEQSCHIFRNRVMAETLQELKHLLPNKKVFKESTHE